MALGLGVGSGGYSSGPMFYWMEYWSIMTNQTYQQVPSAMLRSFTGDSTAKDVDLYFTFTADVSFNTSNDYPRIVKPSGSGGQTTYEVLPVTEVTPIISSGSIHSTHAYKVHITAANFTNASWFQVRTTPTGGSAFVYTYV